jgi:hypothetical protein
VAQIKNRARLDPETTTQIGKKEDSFLKAFFEKIYLAEILDSFAIICCPFFLPGAARVKRQTTHVSHINDDFLDHDSW